MSFQEHQFFSPTLKFQLKVDQLPRHFSFPISRCFSRRRHSLAFKIPKFMAGKENLTFNSPPYRDGIFISSKPLVARLTPTIPTTPPRHLLPKCHLLCFTGQVFTWNMEPSFFLTKSAINLNICRILSSIS